MKRILPFIITILIVTSCNDNQYKDLIKDEISIENNYVTTKAAEVIASNFLSSLNISTKSDSFHEDFVKNAISLKDEKQEPFIHIINFKEGGFAIIPADSRLDPILAYSEDGFFDDNIEKYPGGLVTWLSSINESVQYVRKNNVESIEALELIWDKYLSPPIYTKAIPLPTEEERCRNSVENIKVGPLVLTEWNQNPPYNNLMPEKDCTEDGGGHAYAGCVPIAIAQILRYHEYPNNYQWGEMPYSGASSYTQSLIFGIHNFINMTTDISYNCDATGVSSGYDIGKLFRNYYNYSHATQASFNSMTVQNELLTYNRPVILSGQSFDGGTWPFYDYNGHAWICDGVHRWNTCGGNINGGIIMVGYCHYHMNWGWGGNYDGWYSGPGFQINDNDLNLNYSHDLKMVYQIVP